MWMKDGLLSVVCAVRISSIENVCKIRYFRYKVSRKCLGDDSYVPYFIWKALG